MAEKCVRRRLPRKFGLRHSLLIQAVSRWHTWGVVRHRNETTRMYAPNAKKKTTANRAFSEFVKIDPGFFFLSTRDRISEKTLEQFVLRAVGPCR